MRFVPAIAPTPVAEMNTTPLIDVLLVLLVMLIITIPPQTHAVKLDLPSAPTPPVPVLPKVNLVTISSDAVLRWNGVPLSREQLRQELAASRQIQPSPELHLQPAADARHGDVDEVLVLIKREHIQRFGLVGNDQYRSVF